MKRFLSAVLCTVLLVTSMAVSAFATENTQSERPTLKATYGVNILDPVVSTQDVNAGDTFDISFRLNSNVTYSYVDSTGKPWGGTMNYGTPQWDYSARTTVSVSGTDFTLAGSLAEQEARPGLNRVTILASNGLASGRYQVTLKVTCTAQDGTAVTDTRTFNIDVEASSVDIDETTDAAKFTMTSASIPEGKGRSELSTKLNLKFKNTAGIDANDVSVSLSGLGSMILNTYTDTVELGDVKGGATVSAAFPIKFPEFPTAQMTLVATVSYKDANGKEITENFNVYLQAKEKSKDDSLSETATLTPKVIVSNYATDVEKIVSGDEFILTFVLKNTSLDKDVKNMTVDVIPGTDGSANSTSGTIFSPIDGTTSFHTKQLNKDGELEYSIKLKTSASAGARSYPITIKYNFEYENGSSYATGNGSMDINLPVTQPIKFELMEWNPPTECSADGTTLSFQYFNKSKNPMTNLAVSVEGDFTMPTQYVGTLNASSYDFFSGSMLPVDASAIGETKHAVLVFTFEDASSNEQRVEYPFDVVITESNGGDIGPVGDYEVMDPGMMDPGMEPMDPGMDANGNGISDGKLPTWAKYTMFIGIPVVVIAAIVVAVVLIKKRREKLYEEEEDEE